LEPTREELMDLSGIGAYDERFYRVEIVRWHQWPAYGKEGHEPVPGCWCKPLLSEFDSDGVEVWWHK
jgi:hypothetical protein